MATNNNMEDCLRRVVLLEIAAVCLLIAVGLAVLEHLARPIWRRQSDKAFPVDRYLLIKGLKFTPDPISEILFRIIFYY